MQPTADFNPSKQTKLLLRRSRQGALATLMAGSGDPYCSLVNVASHPDGSPVLLISRLALHTKNLLADARVSLMLDERVEGDPLEGSRIMLAGHAEEVTAGRDIGRESYLTAPPHRGSFRGLQVLFVLPNPSSRNASGCRIRTNPGPATFTVFDGYFGRER